MSSTETFPPVQGEIADFFRHFFQVSDTPDAHDQYPGFFQEDADFIMASKKVRGREDILAVRKGMWTAVQSRHHVVTELFFKDSTDTQSSPQEVMLRGTVEYGFKEGGEGRKDWGAFARLIKQVDGKWRYQYYQVYLDTAK